MNIPIQIHALKRKAHAQRGNEQFGSKSFGLHTSPLDYLSIIVVWQP